MENYLVSYLRIYKRGLDILKENILYEDQMPDKYIYLTFNSKFQEINNEKDKINKIIENLNYSYNLNQIQNIIENKIKEIIDFLTNNLEFATNFSENKININNVNIPEVNQNEILKKFLKDIQIKDEDPKIIEISKNNSENVQNNLEDIEMKDISKSQKEVEDTKKTKRKEKYENLITSPSDKNKENKKKNMLIQSIHRRIQGVIKK